MEFDKSKVLTCVTADQAKVGQKGWFASNVETLSRLVLEEQPKELLGFDSNNAVHAFKTTFQNHALFYPAPEPTHAERQAQWVRENNVKVGTMVRITREFRSSDLSHDCLWNDDMDKTIGLEGTVTRIDKMSMLVKSEEGSWWYPYFALEVIKEPTYCPFANAEEFTPYRDEWVRVKRDGSMVRYFAYNNDGVQDTNGRMVTYKDLFDNAERENGEPCGMKEEV